MAKEKILIVDDEQVIIALLKHLLEKEGYEVIAADSGEAALKFVEKQTIHVMFIDLNLPGMDGIQLCREIKKHSSMTILFSITGYASLFELAECRSAGFEDYFKKPLDISQLKEAVRQAFEKIERWKKGV